MKKTLLTACASLCACLLPLTIQAMPDIWDNQDNNGIWNDPVNWGTNGNPNWNQAPTTADSAIFNGSSPAGTVTLTNDGFAQKLRQTSGAAARTIVINGAQTVDRTLTLAGTIAELFDLVTATANLTLDGTPNGNGARLKLEIDASGTGDGTAVNSGVSLIINCDVSGAGGFLLSPGQSGTGTLVLGGADTYTGATMVNAGTLVVNGSTAAASAVAIASGATLSGTGTIGGPVTVAAGGLVSPGGSVGALAINNSFTLAGNLNIEVNKSSSPSNDMVAVSGLLTNVGTGTLTVVNLGPGLVGGDSFQIFNKPLLNGATLHLVSSGGELWTNRLAVDGSIAVLTNTTTPVQGDPTTVFVWTGTSSDPMNKYWNVGADWVGNIAPKPGSSNIYVFQGDYHPVPDNWPFLTNNLGTSILIFSNTITADDLSIKMLAGWHNTMNFGSYVLQDSPKPMYWGCTGPVPVSTWWVTNAYFTNALGDASVGGQTEFMCTGGRLDLYGVLKDGAGAHSKLVKSGDYTLSFDGDSLLGNDSNTYTGGTIVNGGGSIKMSKLPGFFSIPGDVTVNAAGANLNNNTDGGDQIAHTAIVTLNGAGSFFSLGGFPYTVQTVQGTNTSAYVDTGWSRPP